MNTIQKRKLLQARRNRRAGHGGRWLLIALFGLGSLGAIGASAALGTVYFTYQHYAKGYVPIEERLQLADVGLTEIYDRQGIFLGRLPNPDAQLLEPVPLAQISPNMIAATISTEDNSFYDHPGFNWKGILRAAKENYIDGSGVGSGTGGSSITQQLVKNVYICPSIVLDQSEKLCDPGSAERTLNRKLKELAYAIQLEQDYTKDQILQFYFNQISYADRYIGVQAAAQGYFKKDAIDLTLSEAAMLAGIPSFPTLYHPRKNCVTGDSDECVVDEDGRTVVAGKAKERQELVLNLMVTHGAITRAEADAAIAEPLLVYSAVNQIRAAAFIDNQVQPRLVRMCEAKLLEKVRGTTDCIASVHAAGYKVTTTLDIIQTEVAQAMIQEAIAAGLENDCACHNAAIATIDPATGQIIVYAANIDPSNNIDPRIRGEIDQLTEINQPGSSFKPFVYLAWFDKNNKAPYSTFWDTSPLTIEGVSITNPRRGAVSEGMISARAALGGSQNVGAFRAAAEAGSDNVIEIAKAVGFTTLEQHFDPAFSNHEAVTYGASIATGGANIRAIDMSYAFSVLANMGVMVGVPHLAKEVDVKEMKSLAIETGIGYDQARVQELNFARGHIRLKGTRKLDPVTILQVVSKNGEVLYDHNQANDLQRVQVVNAGSVWLVHSIISDCTSRFIIWGCGSSNSDLSLDSFTDGKLIPSGVKTGTQQGFTSATDTLETWTNGYSRDAAVALWVGNANNELVHDEVRYDFASANTTVRLFKAWMGEYHAYLLRQGKITTLRTFAELQPKNVARVAFRTPTTDRGLAGGCDQTVTGWARTDVKYESECVKVKVDSRNGFLVGKDTPIQFQTEKEFVKPPALFFKKEDVAELAKKFSIPIAPTEVSTGQIPLAIQSPANGRTITRTEPIVGSVNVPGLKTWTLEIGEGAAPTNWARLGGGTNPVSDAVIGQLAVTGANDGIYTLRLIATGDTGTFQTTVTFNVRVTNGLPTQPPAPGRTPTPGGNATPTPTPTPRIPIFPTPTRVPGR